MDTLEAIRNRRSIRQQKSDKIDDATLNKVLEAARWAPSWANTQTWHFVVVRDQETKEKLNATRPQRPPPPPTPGATAPAPLPPPSAPPAILTAPVTIVVCAEKGKAGVRPDGTASTDKGDTWYMYDAGLATQNLCLAAHALGLGTVIMGAFDAPKVGEIIGLPPGFAAVVMVPMGYAAQEARAVNRKELAEIVSYNKFGVGK